MCDKSDLHVWHDMFDSHVCCIVRTYRCDVFDLLFTFVHICAHLCAFCRCTQLQLRWCEGTDVLICVTCLIHVCDVTYLFHTRDVTYLVHTCDMT